MRFTSHEDNKARQQQQNPELHKNPELHTYQGEINNA
jgi:hypothetical protein